MTLTNGRLGPRPVGRFAGLLRTHEHSDMQFYVEQDDVSILAHRTIVGSASDVLKAMVYGVEDLPASRDERGVLVPDCTAKDFAEVLNYLYLEDVQLTLDNATSIMNLAHYFNLPALEASCANYLLPTLNLNPSNVLQIFQQTFRLNNAITAACLDQFKLNIRSMLSEKKFFDLDIAALDLVLGLNQLHIDREFDLFRGLIEWARQHTTGNSVDDIREAVKGRLELIRFSQMTMEEFGECLMLVDDGFFSAQEIGVISLRITKKEKISTDLKSLPWHSKRRLFVHELLVNFDNSAAATTTNGVSVNGFNHGQRNDNIIIDIWIIKHSLKNVNIDINSITFFNIDKNFRSITHGTKELILEPPNNNTVKLAQPIRVIGNLKLTLTYTRRQNYGYNGSDITVRRTAVTPCKDNHLLFLCPNIDCPITKINYIES